MGLNNVYAAGKGNPDGSNGARNGGIGFFGLLTIVFIILKLLGAITWSWAWVLAPLWMPVLLIVIIAVIAGIVLKLNY
jgi:hypothetical protein